MKTRSGNAESVKKAGIQGKFLREHHTDRGAQAKWPKSSPLKCIAETKSTLETQSRERSGAADTTIRKWTGGVTNVKS